MDNWNKWTDCFLSVIKWFLYAYRFTFGWLEAIWFCVARGHISCLPIFVIITSRCSSLLLWRFSAASSGYFSVLKMSGTRWIPNHTLISWSMRSQTMKRNYFIPLTTVYRLDNSMMLNALAVSYEVYFKYFDDRGSPFLFMIPLAWLPLGIKCHSLFTLKKVYCYRALKQYLVPFYSNFIMYSSKPSGW